MTSSEHAAIAAESLAVGYTNDPVVSGLDLAVPVGSFTVIVGPNACGKSTLLRALARLLTPQEGRVVIGGEDVRSLSAKQLARKIGLLPQAPITPDAITVMDLVSRGRYAHQSIVRQWSPDDERAVASAMAASGVSELRNRRVDELSGGQRQRAWIALTLAQETDVLLLDEPTTFLDIAHQVEVLELAVRLREEGRTVVAVLHELGMAARYATHLVAMRDGRIIAQGTPAEVVTEAVLEKVFDLQARVIPDPDTGSPVVLPRTVSRRRQV
ncbi:ABC transporter ATP-binding protein [Aeromicrobium alkaliterrae]|uniref:ABC transporter ATP-binding protein n=1 Tax=Aeromicrobium alkaliterrae TaxID=302168 RepID=A0ABN2JWZ7_9ACTN